MSGARKKKRKPSRQQNRGFRLRVQFMLGVFVLAMAGLVTRAFDLQVLDNEFLEREGKARMVRDELIAAHRGVITDRHGELLAVSSPVDSVWANPKALSKAAGRLPDLARALNRDPDTLAKLVNENLNREFLYLRRQVSPDKAAPVRKLGIPGVYLRREYRRFYPAGEVAGHVLGFTNIDDAGLEGLELAYDNWLRATPGLKRVRKDRLGRTIEDIESLEEARPGQKLVTSLDLRIQYLAYRELKAAVIEHRAKSGSLVVLDVNTGEILAMVNQPAYNPNNRAQYHPDRYRNRATTDSFEPGSSFKPFVIAAALETRRYAPNTIVDTSPGFVRVGSKTIPDKRNLGPISVTTVLTKSSNVGATKIALSMDSEDIWTVLNRFGFGALTSSGFPGESPGLLRDFNDWRRIEQATLSYGYGLSVTSLQLAQAFAAIGSYGLQRPVSFLRVDGPVKAERVISAESAAMLISMMETVVTAEGTGSRAAVSGYRVAGKTGTAWKSARGGYSSDRYVAVFGGLAPASYPRLAAVVVLDEPSGKEYYGGQVAAPVFSHVIGSALRLMSVRPDEPGRFDSDRILQAMGKSR